MHCTCSSIVRCVTSWLEQVSRPCAVEISIDLEIKKWFRLFQSFEDRNFLPRKLELVCIRHRGIETDVKNLDSVVLGECHHDKPVLKNATFDERFVEACVVGQRKLLVLHFILFARQNLVQTQQVAGATRDYDVETFRHL